jgi:type II restriction enzyme
MNLECHLELASLYKAASQIARILTEEWCEREMYCPGCINDHLSRSRANTPAIDFVCENCQQRFQLKAQKKWNRSIIVDGAYRTMLQAVEGDRNPNLFILQYSQSWMIENLQVVPWTFFSPHLIRPRPPLSPGARRAGWIGCNILLKEIPPDGKIPIISSGLSLPPTLVRERFARAQNLADLGQSVRGWTLDVLRVLRRMQKENFSLDDVYGFEDQLRDKHPDNRHVRPKIRQQLQVLRDAGYVEFLGRGRYRTCDPTKEVRSAKPDSQ